MKALFITKDYIIDPLGIAYLSSYLKQAGHEVDILKINGQNTFEYIAESHADMLAYSVTTGNHTFFQQFNEEYRQARGNGSISVFGGAHPTFFPDYSMEQGVDVAVQGEGFDAIVDIANAIDSDSDMNSIPNVVLRGQANPLRPAKPKDSLLLPDRELIYRYTENYNNPIRNVMCSHQCPCQCSYCYAAKYKSMYGMRKAEIRSVENVMIEIEDLHRFPLELIFFQDDLFPIYDKQWLGEFCKAYSKYKTPFHIQVRVEFLTEECVAMLKDVGLHGVTFAIESGNSTLRHDVLKKNIKDETIIAGANLLHKYDIKLRTENMIGFPGETWTTAMQTLDMNAQCNPTIAWASLFQPYPGTELGDKCISEGLFDGDFSNITASFFDTYVLKSSNAKQFERLQKLFSFLVHHPMPRIAIKLLCMLPANQFYKWLYKRYKSYCYKILYKVADSHVISD